MNDSGSGGNSTTIDDLDDNMLTQILFRLPSCATVLACSLVNKRWCSLISDPKFKAHYSNYKKESSTLLEPSSNVNDDEPPWTFISNMIDSKRNVVPQYQYCLGNASDNETVFGSPKFSLGFLPCKVHIIEATFMDLILCSSLVTSPGGDRILIYFLANPLTKQWIVLPPRPVIFNQWRYFKPWVCLVGQQPYDYTQDYKFRVVVIGRCAPPVYELLVYCSEIGEWKRFNLTVSINPKLAAEKHLYNTKFQGVVCNGIIYLHHKLYFAALNPFDVDETTDTNTTIEAKVLPSLPDPIDSYLQESSGKLFIVHNCDEKYSVFYNNYGRAIEFPLKVWKLDPNQVPLLWKTTFEGLCIGNVKNIDSHNGSVSMVGMHPRNHKLIYMRLVEDGRLVLCDTRTRLIKPLNFLPGYISRPFDRLELQWWPTPVSYVCDQFVRDSFN